MTLLYIDGFGHSAAGRYTNASPSAVGLTASPRAPGCYYASGYSGVIKRPFTAASEVFTGIGFNPTTLAANKYILSFFGDAAVTQHISLVLNAAGRIELRLATNNGSVLATGGTTLPVGQWTYIEARATIADSGGVVQVRLNGNTANEIDYTGDTRNAGTNTTIDAISMGGSSTTDYFADWYILNTAGTFNNNWRGDVVVRTLTPNGNGAYSQLSGSDGDTVNNWQLVDEVPPSTSDYVGSQTVDNKDAYTLPDLPATVTTVYGVQVAATMAKSDAGSGAAKILTRSDDTDYTPNTYTLGTSWSETLELSEADPATTLAWTPAGVNALQVGMQVA
jgi:hypothetical protein